MKKLLFILFVGFLPQIIHAQTLGPKAILAREQIWDEENQTYMNKYSSDTNYTLYFVYDDITYNADDICNIVVYDAEHPEVIKVVNSWTKTVDYNGWDKDKVQKFTDKNLRNNFNPTYQYGNVGNRNTTYYGLHGRVPWRQQESWRTTERVVFANSFSNCTVTYLDYWFTGGTGWASYSAYTNNATAQYDVTTTLKKVDGGRNINTTGVTSVLGMFANCTTLEEIDGISTWQLGNVTDFRNMFINCSSLTTLNVSNWDVSSATRTSNMFNGCTNVTFLNLSKWDIKALTTTTGMFKNCTNLETIICLNDWQTMYNKISTTNSADMFTGCTSLVGAIPYDSSKKDIRYANPYTGYFFSIGYAMLDGTTLTFYGGYPEDLPEGTVYWLTDDTGTEVPGWYAHNADITTVVFDSTFRGTKPVSCYKWFEGCSNLTTVTDMANLPTHAVTNMEDMFNGCSSLKRLDVSSWNTANLTNMKQTFYNCSSLTSLTFGADFTSPPGTNSTFSGCSKLRYLDFYNCNAENNNRLTVVQDPETTILTQSYIFYNIPPTTIIYLPPDLDCIYRATTPNTASISDTKKNIVANWRLLKQNTLVSPATLIWQSIGYCAPQYYSEDKVDIELPRDFKTYKAVYSRDMSNGTNYGSVILPYEYSKTVKVQPYKLDEQYLDGGIMHFTDVSSVPAHTPFAFKKLDPDANEVVFTKYSSNYYVLEPDSYTSAIGDITVKATRSTNPDEDTWTGEKGSPYEDTSNINQESNLSNWVTRGYYVTEVLNNTGTIDGETYSMFHIMNNKLLRAEGKTRAYPHRVTFLKKGSSVGGAKSFDIDTSATEDEVITAIKEAELRKDMREAEAIYDMQGRKIPALQKGINIVRMSDGTIKKVIMK